MAKGSGGTRGASGGGSARGGGGMTSDGRSIVLKGGWSGSDKETAFIVINGINKETEKAVNVKTLVDWAKGKAHEKDIWVPKNTIKQIDKKPGSNTMTLLMKKSMAQSIAQKNNFKGYDMDFTNSYNVWGP